MPPVTSRAGVLRRDLRAMTADGICFSAMVGLGEAYVPAFALALGHGAAAAGLLATLPLLAGACFQLVTPEAVRRLRSYRLWVVGCARFQALCFVPLALAALFAWGPLAWLLALTSTYWGFGMATGPAWNAWATSLVPARLRVRFFARRSRSAQAALLIALLCSGAVLETGRRARPRAGRLRGALRAAAGARLLSARFLARQSEIRAPPRITAPVAARRCAPACARAANARARVSARDAVRRAHRGALLHSVHARPARAQLRALHRADRRLVPGAHRDPARARASGAARAAAASSWSPARSASSRCRRSGSSPTTSRISSRSSSSRAAPGPPSSTPRCSRSSRGSTSAIAPACCRSSTWRTRPR